LKYQKPARHQWLTPVILATQEAEIEANKLFMTVYFENKSQRKGCLKPCGWRMYFRAVTHGKFFPKSPKWTTQCQALKAQVGGLENLGVLSGVFAMYVEDFEASYKK
jgi:hypothetical protein